MLLFDSPILFEQAAQELLRHLSHKITITPHGGDAAPDSGVRRLPRMPDRLLARGQRIGTA